MIPPTVAAPQTERIGIHRVMTLGEMCPRDRREAGVILGENRECL